MRIDGRKNDQIRPVKITTGYTKYAEGSVLFEQVQTKVICTASVEDKLPPFLKDSGRGWITAEYAMMPRATQTRSIRESARGKVGGRTHEIQRLIGRSLRTAVNLKHLGERTIWLDCDVIQADGGTRTAAITGSFIALALALAYIKEEYNINNKLIKDIVAAISVGVVKGKALLDLCYAEDSLADTDMNVVMVEAGKFIEIQGTAEKKPFDSSELTVMLSLAQDGVNQLIAKQKEILGDKINV